MSVPVFYKTSPSSECGLACQWQAPYIQCCRAHPQDN
uniref:Uncharacterized protein n=1 Tax=Anguilla anguilla TaxID=7936 RepID=A0A0E9QFA6_ANGAN